VNVRLPKLPDYLEHRTLQLAQIIERLAGHQSIPDSQTR
jgi:hypothetical protein